MKHTHLGSLSVGPLRAAAMLLALWSAAAVGATEDDRLLASQCLGCHAADSTGRGGFDRLTGETASEITEEMVEMRNKSGSGNIMHLQARGYDDAQIQRIAQWFAVNAGTVAAAPNKAYEEHKGEKKEESKKEEPKKVSLPASGKSTKAPVRLSAEQIRALAKRR